VLNFRSIPPVLLLFLFLYPLSLVLVFVCSRYRTPVIPVLCIPAALAISQISRLFKSRLFLKAGLLMALVAMLAIGFSLDGPFVQEKYDYLPEMYYCVAFELREKGDFIKARDYASMAVAARPDYADALALLGRAYSSTGRPDLAVEYLSKSLQINPDHYIRRYFLAENLLKLNRPAEAKEHLNRALTEAEQKMDFFRLGAMQGLRKQIPEPNVPVE
jgi:tetratricopeptide (TPR) repeat protein